MTKQASRNGNDARRVLRRGPWENASAVVIGLGILMQMQPFALELTVHTHAQLCGRIFGLRDVVGSAELGRVHALGEAEDRGHDDDRKVRDTAVGA